MKEPAAPSACLPTARSQFFDSQRVPLLLGIGTLPGRLGALAPALLSARQRGAPLLLGSVAVQRWPSSSCHVLLPRAIPAHPVHMPAPCGALPQCLACLPLLAYYRHPCRTWRSQSVCHPCACKPLPHVTMLYSAQRARRPAAQRLVGTRGTRKGGINRRVGRRRQVGVYFSWVRTTSAKSRSGVLRIQAGPLGCQLSAGWVACSSECTERRRTGQRGSNSGG